MKCVLIRINRPARHRAQRQGRGEAVDNLGASCKSTTGPTHLSTTKTPYLHLHPVLHVPVRGFTGEGVAPPGREAELWSSARRAADRCGPRSRKIVVRPRFSSVGSLTALIIRTRWQNLAFATFQLTSCHRGRAPSSTGARHDGRTGRRSRREGR